MFGSGIGSISNLNGKLELKNSTIALTNNGFYSSPIYGFNSNNTIRFTVSGQESNENPHGLIYKVTTSAITTYVWVGIQPTSVTCNSSYCSKSYNGYEEIVTYNSGASADTLTLIWPVGPVIVYPIETQAVLFYDDFLRSGLPSNSWTLSSYSNINLTQGIYTTGGFLVINAQKGINEETSHVNTPPAFSPSSYSSVITIKRKLTVSLYPFNSQKSPATAALHIGFTPLLTSGAYPGSSPANTPNYENGACTLSSTSNDNIGSEYFYIDNSGTTSAIICGNPSGSVYSSTLEVLNPKLYTVITIEFSAIFCPSGCNNNVQPGTIPWTYFRVYQENNNGTVLSSTDVNVNVTATQFSNMSPLFQNSYIFVHQDDTDNAASGETSYIDLVHLQNYGSPVCLFNCSQPIPSSTILNNLLLQGLNWLAGVIAGGNSTVGWYLLVFMFTTAAFGIPYLYLKDWLPGASIGMLVLAMFSLWGVIPNWMIAMPILVGAFLLYSAYNRYMGTSYRSGGV